MRSERKYEERTEEQDSRVGHHVIATRNGRKEKPNTVQELEKGDQRRGGI